MKRTSINIWVSFLFTILIEDGLQLQKAFSTRKTISPLRWVRTHTQSWGLRERAQQSKCKVCYFFPLQWSRRAGGAAPLVAPDDEFRLAFTAERLEIYYYSFLIRRRRAQTKRRVVSTKRQKAEREQSNLLSHFAVGSCLSSFIRTGRPRQCAFLLADQFFV